MATSRPERGPSRSCRPTRSPMALDVLGRCNRRESCESGAATAGLSQKLHLLNGGLINAKLASPDGRLRRLIDADKTNEEIVGEFYVRSLSREPRPAERGHWKKLLGSDGPRRGGSAGGLRLGLAELPGVYGEPLSEIPGDANTDREETAVQTIRCDGITRRDALRVGTLTGLGLTLPEVLRRRAWAAERSAGREPRARAAS